MSTSSVKRRRIDAANKTLSKPFRSPFKSPLKQSTQIDEGGSTTFAAAAASLPNADSANSDTQESISQLRSSLTLPSLKSTSCRTSAKKTFISPTSNAALNSDPSIAPLLESQRKLERQIREIKQEIDTAEQARKIENESRRRDPSGASEVDAELVVLIGKWKNASRAAAEELFGKVRDRVNRMGGPRAWKEMQKRQQAARDGWQMDIEERENKQDGGAEERRHLQAEYDIDLDTENERSHQVGIETGEMPGQEDEFTIAMMLRTLNVDLKAIGYDNEQERWTD